MQAALCVQDVAAVNKGCTTQVSQAFVTFTQTDCFEETDLSHTYLAHHDVEIDLSLLFFLLLHRPPPAHLHGMHNFACTHAHCLHAAL